MSTTLPQDVAHQARGQLLRFSSLEGDYLQGSLIMFCKQLGVIDQIHTYIIDHCKPSVRVIDLVSHTTYVVCVNFIHKWRNLLFKDE